MGWFSVDEIVAPATSSVGPVQSHTAQTEALCVLAGIAFAYVAKKMLSKVHRHHTERLAERAARRVAMPV